MAAGAARHSIPR